MKRTIREKILNVSPIVLDNDEVATLVIYQKYIGITGHTSWFPISLKKSRIVTKAGEVIPSCKYSKAVRTKVRKQKAKIPFLLSMYRNTFLFLLLIFMITLLLFNIK